MFKKLNYTRKSEYNGQVRAFLDNLFHCRFNGYKDYLTFLSHPGLSSPRFRLSSKSLSSPPLCKKEVTTYTNESDFLRYCPLLNAKWVSIVCARKMHIVLSVYANRAPGGGLAGLVPLMTSESMAIRVLHLVRDPRAIIWEMISRGKYSMEADSQQGGELEDKIKKRCNKLNKNVDFSLSLPYDLKEQYRILRYEDVLKNLAKAANISFEFTGIDQVSEVDEYIRDKEQNLVNDDSSWRRKMTMKLVSKVDHYCAHVMKILGYKTLRNKKDLRNLDHSLLEEYIERSVY
jgi:hypothetical protein